MSQRFMFKVQPDERKPLWHSASGVPFYLPMGQAPDGDDAGDGDDNGDGGDGASGSGDGGDGGSGSEGQGDNTGDEKVSRAELDKALARMRAADKRADEAQKAIEEAQRKEKSELENTQTDLKKATERAEQAEKRVTDLLVQNAFLGSNDIKWHNPMRALQMVDLSEVSIDEDGNVDAKALKKALKSLAESDSYLVKKDDDDGETPPGPSGDGSVGNGKNGKNGKGKFDRAVLEQSFPALRTRG